MTNKYSLNQVKDLLEIHENTIIKIFNDRLQKLESELIIIKEENIDLKRELNDTNKTLVFVSEQYETIKETLNITQKNPLGRLNQKSLNEENDALKNKIAELEDRSRRNNLRFEGIEETEGETWEKSEELIKNLLKEKLNIKDGIQIERAHRAGRKDNEKDKQRKRTIVVKFLNFKDREIILEKYRKLKLWNENMYINEDFSERTTSIRKQLFKQAKEMRATGKFARVVYNKIITKPS
jgi:hypothetical protein